MHMKRHVSADREAHENDVFRALAAFVGYFRRKPSVICTDCTPLNTVSAGSTPGLNRVRKEKNQIFTTQMRHSCTLSGRKQPQTLIRSTSSASPPGVEKDGGRRPAATTATNA